MPEKRNADKPNTAMNDIENKTWLCVTCFGRPRSKIRMDARIDRKTMNFCNRCGGPKEFEFMEASRQSKGKRVRAKPAKAFSEVQTRENLLNAVIRKGLGVRKANYNRFTAKTINLKCLQLSNEDIRGAGFQEYP